MATAGKQQQLWRRTLQLGPYATEKVGLSATTSAPQLQVLVVPGNPGQACFYAPFLQQLYSLFGGAADVWAAAHVGHDARGLDAASKRVWCLDSQIDHKRRLLRDVALAPGRTAGCPLIVVAHSIGAYMVLRALEQLEQEQQQLEQQQQQLEHQQPQRVVKVVLLMPFLSADFTSARQRLLRAASGAAPLIGAAAGLVAALPGRARDALLALAAAAGGSREPHVLPAMRGLVTRHAVANAFHLAWHEFRDLDQPAPWHLVARLGRRAAVVAAPDDMWFSRAAYEELRRNVPGLRTSDGTSTSSSGGSSGSSSSDDGGELIWHDGLTHAFCLSAAQSAVVAELVHASVLRALGADAALTPSVPSLAQAAAAAAAPTERSSSSSGIGSADAAAAAKAAALAGGVERDTAAALGDQDAAVLVN